MMGFLSCKTKTYFNLLIFVNYIVLLNIYKALCRLSSYLIFMTWSSANRSKLLCYWFSLHSEFPDEIICMNIEEDR